ncbi:MAG: GNAT family protein [Anaerolineales bacterium]|jgi:RimJ/RimL family protein N-acetyltransferase
MNFNRPLFTSVHIRLAPINYEKDPEVESRWTHDADYLRLIDTEPARPLSPLQVKARYEEIEKNIEESKDRFYFTIRTCEDERLIGYAEVAWILWKNGYGFVKLAIPDPANRGRGYGSEALSLILRYAFDELGLYRLSALVPEYNKMAQRFFEKAGFIEEIRRRQALYRDGRRWDMLHMGLLNEEWLSLQ